MGVDEINSNPEHSMTNYTILNADGDTMGTYSAGSGEDAILAYVVDAGYRTVADAADVDPSVSDLTAVAS